MVESVRVRAPVTLPLTLARAVVGGSPRLHAVVAHATAAVDVDHLLAEPTDARALFRADYLRLLVAAAGPVVALPHPDERAPRHRVAAARLSLAGWPTRTERDLEGYDHVRLRELVDRLWPARRALRRAGAVGSPAPTVLLVADRETVPRGMPLFARSGAWALAALRRLGHDPLACAVVNAHDVAGEANASLEAALAAVRALRDPPRVVALGERAADRLEALGVGHVFSPHPAWHRRFHHAEGPEGFAARLRAEGLRPGPYLVRGELVPLPGFPEAPFAAFGGGFVPRVYRDLLDDRAVLMVGSGDPA